MSADVNSSVLLESRVDTTPTLLKSCANWLLPMRCRALKPFSGYTASAHLNRRPGREEGAATTAEGPIRGSARTLQQSAAIGHRRKYG